MWEREIPRAASRALPAGSEIVTRSQVPSSPSAVISSLFICCGLHFVRFVSSLCKNEQTCCSKKKHRSTSVSPERSHECNGALTPPKIDDLDFCRCVQPYESNEDDLRVGCGDVRSSDEVSERRLPRGG